MSQSLSKVRIIETLTSINLFNIPKLEGIIKHEHGLSEDEINLISSLIVNLKQITDEGLKKLKKQE